MSHDWIYERCDDCDHSDEDGNCLVGLEPVECAFEGLATQADDVVDQSKDEN